ncbi:hypothetical protein FBT15_00320 [Neisseria gonorrhoeae]
MKLRQTQRILFLYGYSKSEWERYAEAAGSGNKGGGKSGGRHETEKRHQVCKRRIHARRSGKNPPADSVL